MAQPPTQAVSRDARRPLADGIVASLSVVICTHDRASSLARTLKALDACTVPVGCSVETVVVANACADDTIRVCQRHGVNVVEAPQRGLGRARNVGISAAAGDAVLWLDDDVTPSTRLLVAYHEALARYPDALFFGGPIRPLLEGTPPFWAADALEVIPTVWSGLDLGDRTRTFDVLNANEYPFGANMLTRRGALAGGFCDALGRRGGDAWLIGGEERELFRRLALTGHVGQWVSDAWVEHRVGPDRQTLGYVARYFRGNGYQEVLRRRDVPGTAAARLRAELRVGFNAVCFAAQYPLAPPKVWLQTLKRLNVSLGRAAAVRRRASLAHREPRA